MKIPKGSPERIWLQLGPERVERETKFTDYGEVTWSEDRIDEADIEYIRADLVSAVRKLRVGVTNES